jgi:hypothetical protein
MLCPFYRRHADLILVLQDLANKYVEKFIDVSIMEVRNCCLSGSMIYHLLELKSAQV